jgi:TPR repeat protein
VGAAQGEVGAQNSLGVSYENGRGVEKDAKKEVRWYRKAAEQGHADGQINLGWMYQHGSGVEKDYTEAMRWYRKAAAQNLAVAQNNIGDMSFYQRPDQKLTAPTRPSIFRGKWRVT